MKKLTKILVLGLAFQACTVLYAQDMLKSLFPEDICNTLITKGSYKSINEDGDYEYHVLPECEYSEQIKKNRVQRGGMNLVAEQAYLVKKDDLKKTRTYENGQPDLKDAAEIFTSVSEMEKAVYYSNTRRKYMNLYKIVSYIDNLENPKKLDDLRLKETDGVESYFQMHDASFGLNYFSLKYKQNESTLFVNIVNMDPMGFAGVKGVQAKDLIINYLVVDCGDCYVLYLGADIKMTKVPGMRTKIIKSYDSRLSAMYNWFKEQF
ncbi:MAG: hypothetical protein MJ181_01555 [Treponema sp.]|nr:hypothetical protein [Treponema sp.]